MKSHTLINFVTLFFLTFSAAAVAQNNLPPKKLTLTYKASKEGKPFATVVEKFTQDGANYRIESITKGIGVYALFGERKLVSTGIISAAGLQPTHFEAHQGDNAKKSVSADFDWQNLTLNMTQKGKTNSVPLITSTQDLLSFAYQFMFINIELLTPKPVEYKVNLTTGKKMKSYNFAVEQPKDALTTMAGQFKTAYLKEITTDNTPPSKELWLGLQKSGSSAYGLPIKLIIRDDNSTIEQVLTSINAE